MDQRQWNLTVIPRRDVGAGLELTRLREPFGDPLQVVFEPVRHEQRLAVGRLDQVFEGVEFALMNYRGVASLVVDRARASCSSLPKSAAAFAASMTCSSRSSTISSRNC